MNKIILALLLLISVVSAKGFATNTVISVTTTTNVFLFVRMQWGTNGSGIWHDDIIRDDFDDTWVYPVGNISTNCLFYSAITADGGNVDVYKTWEVTTFYSENCSTAFAPLATNIFYVRPNAFDSHGTNLIYRPVLALTNYAATGTSPATTNAPGDPTPPQ